jgi:hypothetical protein
MTKEAVPPLSTRKEDIAYFDFVEKSINSDLKITL